PQSRSDPAAGSGIGFTSPPQTNSEMLRGPFSGQFRIFMLTNSVPHGGSAFFADLGEVDEAVAAEGLRGVGHLARGDGSGHALAADGRGLEAQVPQPESM